MSGIASMADVVAAESKGVPVDWPSNTYELIRRGAMLDPDAPALSFFLTTAEHRRPETWSHRALFERITQAANFFHSLGATRDTVIAFVLPNLPETHFVIWGGQAAGIVTALNPLLEPAALVDLLIAAKAEVLVTLAPFPGADLWQKLQPGLGKVPSLRHLVLVNLADRVRGVRHFAARFLQWREERRLCGSGGVNAAVPSTIRVHDFNASIARQPGDRLVSGRTIRSEDVSSCFCTGGTTGLPKIAVRTHGCEVANTWMATQFLGDSIGNGKTIFCGLPLFHVNAVLVTGLLPFSKGAHVLLGTPQGYRGEGIIPRFWEIVEQHRVNFFSGVPTLYAGLLQVPIEGRDIRSLEYGLCGAAPMPVEVFRTFQERTGLKILEGYGLTEGTCVSSVNPPLGERRLGSIGLRVPGQLMKPVLLDEQGHYQRDCAVGEVGVLAISGPNVFLGYRQPEQNKGLWIDCGDGRRWLNTGDLGRVDAEGYFWLTGRKKELIIRGGHNIDPLIIEEPLHRHPAVQVAAAIGRPDAHAGELPVAYVQLRAGTKATESELAEFLAREISERAAVPKQVRIIDEMPLTAVGKIYKPALKIRETRDALEAALCSEGIAFSAVDVSDEKSKGMVVKVVVQSTVAAEAAKKALGRFPFAFSVSLQN